jgi:hypothetical protein
MQALSTAKGTPFLYAKYIACLALATPAILYLLLDLPRGPSRRGFVFLGIQLLLVALSLAGNRVARILWLGICIVTAVTALMAGLHIRELYGGGLGPLISAALYVLAAGMVTIPGPVARYLERDRPASAGA